MANSNNEVLGNLSGNSKIVIHSGAGKDKEIACYFEKDSLEIDNEVDVSVRTKPGSNEPIEQYHGAKARTCKFVVKFDTDYRKEITAQGEIKEYQAKDVTKITNVIENATKIAEELHRPPTVDFIWGSVNISGIIKKATINIQAFNREGIPVRARVAIELLEYSEKPKKTSKQSPDRTKSRVMTPDSSMWLMAYNEYGDDADWRKIAKANNIMDPLNIPQGKSIKIPAL